MNTSVHSRPMVKRHDARRSPSGTSSAARCASSFLRPLSRNAGSASWILRTGVIWHGTPTKQTFLRPMRSASASARLFGQYVYQELALVIASSTVVTTFGFGARGHGLVGGRDARAVEEPLAQPVAAGSPSPRRRPGSAPGSPGPCSAPRRCAGSARRRPRTRPAPSARTASRRSNSRMPRRGTHLRADVAADALADAAEVEGRRRLRDLLRLAVDVVDDVVRADEHAGAALAAAAVRRRPRSSSA